jgi:adenosine deaminase
LTAKDAYQLALNSFEASFVDESCKTRWAQALDNAFPRA